MSMLQQSVLPILVALGALAACSPEAPEPVATAAERQQALRESAFGAMVEPLERAAEVEQLQRDRKREVDAALDR